MPAGSAAARRTSSAITIAPRSSGRTSASAPRNRPTGVRTASAISTSRKGPAMIEIYLLKGAHRGQAGDGAPLAVGHGYEGRDRNGRARPLRRRRIFVVDV